MRLPGWKQLWSTLVARRTPARSTGSDRERQRLLIWRNAW